MHGKQFRRRWVLPKDRRTVKQRRWRARLGAASQAYSGGLTQAQKDTYIASAAKRRTRRRLGRSGPLTGQQYSVGKECRDFARQERRKSIIIKAKALHSQALTKVATAQVLKRQRLTGGTWEIHAGASTYTPDRLKGNKGARPARAGRRKEAKGRV
jgi:hypothetical protein